MSPKARLMVVLASFAVLAGSPAVSVAQDIGSLPVPLVELSGGYVLMRDTSTENRYPRGWYASGGMNMNQWFGLFAEAGGSYRSLDDTFLDGAGRLAEKAQVYTVLGGPRFFHKTGRLVPFAQVLVGAATRRLQQTTTLAGEGPGAGVNTWKHSSTSFAIQPGGGLEVYLTEGLGVVVEGDYRSIIDQNDDSVWHELRVLTGFTFLWGRR